MTCELGVLLALTSSATAMWFPGNAFAERASGATVISPMAAASPAAVNIAVSPTSATLTPGQQQRFTAGLSDKSNSRFQWSLMPPVGTITETFLWTVTPTGSYFVDTAVYTAPANISIPQSVTLVLTDTNSDRATALINLAPTSTAAPGVNVSITPGSAFLSYAESRQFTALVTGTAHNDVTWSLSPAIGTLVNGFYTAPATINTGQIVTIVATSVADPTKAASALILLTPTAAVAITPTAISLGGGQTQQFTASVTGPENAAVTWSLSPALGTIVNGLYGAPPLVSTAQTVTVTATSATDPTQKGKAVISLVPVTIGISPSAVSLGAAQSQQFNAAVNGTSNSQLVWSLSPAVGTIVNGLYTAPGSLTTQQTVTLTATSVADPSKTATASITLVPPVTVTMAPSSASLAASQIIQFNTTVGGTSNTQVMWTLNPAVGTIANGLYTAPATVSVARTVTLTATSLADPTKTAIATISLVPVTVAMTPAAVTLRSGQSIQFNLSVAGTANTAATWWLNPAVGTVANGVYTAPATINAQQTVTITAASQSDPIKTAQSFITLLTSAPASLSVSPAQATLLPSQALQFAAVVQGGANSNVQWAMSPMTGTIAANGLYTAPANVAVQQSVTITATSTTDPAANGTAVITLLPVAKTKLPVEVVGPAGTIETATVLIPPGISLSGAPKLWMQIHGLRYSGKASVQVNASPWVTIKDDTVTLLGLAKSWGGIGGGFPTLKMTLDLPPGTLVPGSNTVSFRFNATGGGLGFRVLKFNFLTTDGSTVLSDDSFVQDDPNTWTPPLNSQSDIDQGKWLFQNASILHAGKPVRVHCNNCHTQDGRDLHYYNYSSKFLHYGAVISGLTDHQGDQIASYIRSINFPNPGRPWNPPYQPGPGMDSKPVSEWAAGAGLDAVVDSDADMLPYMMPGGSTANWSPAANLGAREVPISIQLPDWNHWLPTVNPLDAWGDSFLNALVFTNYQLIRNTLQPNNPASYLAADGAIWGWIQADQVFLNPLTKPSTDPAWNDPNYVAAVYSTRLWSMVKNWEINQEFGLEGMPAVPFGPQADIRAWYSPLPFFASPNMLRIPPGKVGNGTVASHDYHSYAWYHLQLLLNAGNNRGTGLGASADYPYVYNFVQAQGYDLTPSTYPAMLMTLWLVKAMQGSENGVGPEQGSIGWTPINNNPSRLLQTLYTMWGPGISPAQRTAVMQAYVQNWVNKVTSYTPSQFYQGGWASPTEIPDPQWPDHRFVDWVAFMIPQFQYQGVSMGLMDQLRAWAATMWPAYNWAATRNAVCVDGTGLRPTCTW